MKAQEIREVFLDYFAGQGHKVVKSSPLLPKDDPTILFTNAGMNQFKNIFVGLEKRSNKRAASVQKCMRVSGKHNDLEQVGKTAKHHTFFEMLGNFSFGDYFKREAIRFAWEFVTDVIKLDSRRLYVTIYTEDDEADEIWRKEVGLPASRIFRFGKKDNFWAMGETGPCGPCSEIHYDLGAEIEAGEPEALIESGSDRIMELWNLVFMQFFQDEKGRQTPLPSPSIDTGMGLERTAAVLQNKPSNFSTDLFLPLIEAVCEMSGREYPGQEDDDVSIRIIADHIRAVSFLIGDDIMPANEGRGYVLRRLIRRAFRKGNFLGLEEPFLYRLVGVVCEIMKDAYPELLASSEYIAKLCQSEERRFSSTLTSGMRTFKQFVEESRSGGQSRLSGEQVFKLYDTFGFPLDLSRELAEELDLAVDEQGFQLELEKQKQKARQAWRGDVRQKERKTYESLKIGPTRCLSYEAEKLSDARVVALIREGKAVSELRQGEEGEIFLDSTPFYAEAGGQVGDAGVITNPHCSAVVETAYYPLPEIIAHKVRVIAGHLRRDDRVEAEINTARRKAISRNHTTTHLLHASLRAVLGDHVKQAGSLVSASRLRFDFTHFSSLSDPEIVQLETMINEKIRGNMPVETAVTSLEEGISMGAMAIFEEKYGESVRMVTIGEFSRELCGGVHVRSTGEIGLMKILSESSIAAGMRRIEAVTGEEALIHVQDSASLLKDIETSLNSSRSNLLAQLERLKESIKALEKENKALRQKLTHARYHEPGEKIRKVRGISVIVQKVEGLNPDELRQLNDSLKQKLGSGVVILGTASDRKAFLTAGVTKDLATKISAEALIKKLAPIVGGGGGGRPEFAQAGGTKPDMLDKVIKEGCDVLEELLAEG